MPKPLLQALLLADHVYQDRDTGKKVIAGTFNQLHLTKAKPAPKETEPPAAGPAGGQGAAPAGEPAPGPGSAAGPGAGPGDGPGAGPSGGPAGGVAGGPGKGPAKGPRIIPAGQVSRVGSPTAFISLTDIRGTVQLELRYVDLADNEVLLKAPLQIQSDDPLRTIEAVIAVPPLPVPHPGVYALELLCDDEPLGSLRVTVVETPSP